MGIYDRGYYRDDRGAAWFAGRSMVFNIIALNVLIYLADLLSGNKIDEACGLHSNLFQNPWQCWQLVSYGFLHDPNDIRHILFNMFGVWMFGSDIEAIYGRAEFLRIYLTAVVVAGLAWAGYMTFADMPGLLIGASGALMAVIVLFVLHFPRRMIYIWGVLPIPAWLFGGLYVLLDLVGVSNQDNVAHVAHLGGAAFGGLYYASGWNLGRMVPSRLSWNTFRFRPKLKIHDPESEHDDLNQQVDQILAKISRTGESSLTKKERQTLERASRRYQQRRH